MSQNSVSNDTCPTCKNGWVTHHTFDEFSDRGKPRFHCHRDPIETPDLRVQYIIGLRTDKLEAQASLLAFKKQAALDRQASEAELERKFASSVAAEAAKKAAADITEIEADYKKALEAGEVTRVQLIEKHDAVLLDKQALLNELTGERDRLIVDKADLAKGKADLEAKLAEREQRIVDLHLEIEDLKAALEEERRHHDGLKLKTKDIIHLAFTLGKRVVVLERKQGVNDEVDIEDLFNKLVGQPKPPEVETADRAMRAEPNPAPPQAPKAVATAVVVDVHTPVPPLKTVELDDPMPESEPSDPSDDTSVGEDQDVDDGDIEQETPAAFEEDESSEEERETCSASGCDEIAHERMTYIKKDGTNGVLAACNPTKHAAAFLTYLKKAARNAPESATNVVLRFNPIA